jgi:hypothetical protein
VIRSASTGPTVAAAISNSPIPVTLPRAAMRMESATMTTIRVTSAPRLLRATCASSASTPTKAVTRSVRTATDMESLSASGLPVRSAKRLAYQDKDPYRVRFTARV